MRKVFKSDLEIPDICPPELVLPSESNFLDMVIPREDGNVSPIELSWLLFDQQRSANSRTIQLHAYLSATALLGEATISRVHDDILYSVFLNHNLRVFARIALDPRRYTAFDFAEAYDLDRSKLYPNNGERIYFEEFHNTYGVVERPAIEA